MRTLYSRIKYKYLLYPLVVFFRFFSINKKPLDRPHFFIIGSGRNGSTLLATILNAHKDILIPPEQFILPYAILRRYLFFFWSSERWVNNVKQLFLTNTKTIKWNLDIGDIVGNKKSISSLFNNIFAKYQERVKPGSIIWGDKTPLNTNFIRYIYPEFPKAKYIFLVRDPRDVALSYKKYLGFNFFTFGIWKWQDSVKAYNFLKKRGDVLLVKYEDLVADPDQEVKRIITHLDLDEDKTSDIDKVSAKQMGVEDDYHHKNLKKPISTRSVGNWKNKLLEEEKKCFNGDMSAKMQEFGYKS